MKINWTTDMRGIYAAWRGYDGEMEWPEFALDFLKDKIQVIHDRSDIIILEGVKPNEQYEVYFGKTMTADTFSANDGTIERTTGEPPVKQEDQAARVARGLELKDLFDDVFVAALNSGLLVDKAIAKAHDAVSKADRIDAARNSAVLARLSEEFGDDPA